MSDKQVTSGLQAFCEAIDELCLGLVAEIDHDVSAEDDIESADVGPGLDQIYSLKVDHVDDFRPHSIPAIPMAFAAQEMLAKPWNRCVLEPLSRVCAIASRFKSACGDIGSKNMRQSFAASLEVFAGDQRDGVRFLAAGASCAPDAHRTTACPLRADRVHQKVEVCLLTKEAGVIGGEAVNQLNEVLAGMIGLQMFIKIAEI